MTSGNTGAGLAVVCNYFGNPFIAFMSEGKSKERAKILEALGTELYLVPQVEGIPGKVTGKDIEAAEHKARQYAKEVGAFYVDQFNREAGVTAYKEGTGPEIWNDLNGDVDAFVAAVESGGTFVGVSKFLKSKTK
jgi:cysteine synthase A